MQDFFGQCQWSRGPQQARFKNSSNRWFSWSFPQAGELGALFKEETSRSCFPDQAIEILEARRDITVVFTDIQMPGSMDGLKLARAVRGRWPPIKIVATSGHINVGECDLPEGGRFLLKPYSPLQVTGVLRELTGAA